MLANFVDTFKCKTDYQEQIELQKESLMKRVWLTHSLKTAILILIATFGTPYWE